MRDRSRIIPRMRKLDTEKRAAVLSALVEGNSIAATCRMFAVNKVTVLRLIADAGTLALQYHDLTVRNLFTKRVQVGYRKRVFEHAVRIPLHRVYELKSGGVASILREDAGGVGELVFSMIYNPSKAVVQLIG